MKIDLNKKLLASITLLMIIFLSTSGILYNSSILSNNFSEIDINQSNGLNISDESKKIHLIDPIILDGHNGHIFSIADIDADQKDEFISFRNIINKADLNTQIIIHHWNGIKWEQKYDSYNLSITGLTYLASTGNFDKDQNEEIIIVNNVNETVCKAYLLDFDRENNVHYYEIFFSENYISDMCVGRIDATSTDNVYLLTYYINESSLLIINNIFEISVFSDKKVNSQIIYNTTSEYWKCITLGSFFDGYSNKKQIILSQFWKTYTKIKILDFNMKNYCCEFNLDITNDPRDIGAYDKNDDGRDELFILESNNYGNGQGYISEISFFHIYQTCAILESKINLKSKKWMKQCVIGNLLDSSSDELFIIDPPGNDVRILVAVDDDFELFYDIIGRDWLLYTLLPQWLIFESYYAAQNVDIIIVDVISYTSIGSTTLELYNDVKSNIPSATRKAYYADYVMALCLNPHWDFWVGGKGSLAYSSSRPGRYCIIFNQLAGIMAHELGHSFGLYNYYSVDPNAPHCPNIFCIMCGEFLFQFLFCDVCAGKMKRDIFSVNRDYTIPTPVIVSSGAHHHNDVGTWQVSGTFPSSWTVKVYIDNVYHGDTIGTYNIPTTPGYHTLRVELYEYDSTIPHISEDTVYIYPNRAPVADAGADIITYEGNEIYFNGYGSYDLDEDSLTYSWNFGDGNTGTGPNTANTYYTEGTYTVTLTVSDGYGGSDSDTLTVIVQDDDITPPEIIIQYLNGNNSDSNPGIWNVRISDPKQMSYIEVKINDLIIDQFDYLPTFNKDYDVPNSLGTHLIDVIACDNDNSPATSIQSSSLTIVDDDPNPPIISNIEIIDTPIDLSVNFNILNEIEGDDQGVSEIKIFVDDILIISSQPDPTETTFSFTFDGGWLMELGTYEVKIEVTDNDDDRIDDSLTSIITDYFKTTLEDCYLYVDWQIEELKAYIDENLSQRKGRCLNWKLSKAQEYLAEAFTLVESGKITCALYHDKMAKVFVQITEFKNEIYDKHWNNKHCCLSDDQTIYIRDTLHTIRNNIVILMGASIGSEQAYDIAYIEIDLLNLSDFIEEEISSCIGKYLSWKVYCASKMLESAIFEIAMEKDIECILNCVQWKLERVLWKINWFLNKGRISEDLADYMIKEITRIMEAIEQIIPN